jgi:hypothetical protein
MKSILRTTIFIAAFTACKNQSCMSQSTFVSEPVSRTASIVLHAPIARVFPLFGPYEEEKWAEGWKPVPVFPADRSVQEGTTFKTPAHGHNEGEYLWVISKYQPTDHLVQYLVFTINRHWTITVQCKPLNGSSTMATVTYHYIGHNKLGNEINQAAIAKMYAHDLKDWEKAINDHLRQQMK